MKVSTTYEALLLARKELGTEAVVLLIEPDGDQVFATVETVLKMLAAVGQDESAAAAIAVAEHGERRFPVLASYQDGFMYGVFECDSDINISGGAPPGAIVN